MFIQHSFFYFKKKKKKKKKKNSETASELFKMIQLIFENWQRFYSQIHAKWQAKQIKC